MSSSEGFSYTLEFSISDPQRIEAYAEVHHPTIYGEVLQDACDTEFNATTDAVLSGELTATATTIDRPTPVSLRGIFSRWGLVLDEESDYSGAGAPPFQGDGRVIVAQFYSDDEACRSMSTTDVYGFRHASLMYVSWSAVSPGERVTHPFFLVIKDYYSEATPDGDPALLDWIVFRPVFTSAMGTSDFTDDPHDRLSYLSERGFTLAGREISSAPQLEVPIG